MNKVTIELEEYNRLRDLDSAIKAKGGIRWVNGSKGDTFLIVPGNEIIDKLSKELSDIRKDIDKRVNEEFERIKKARKILGIKY